MTGSTIGETVKTSARASEATLICIDEQPSHADAAQKFCTGKLSRYFGDVDILRSAIEEYLKSPNNSCPVDYTPTTEGSYEPYAFVVSMQTSWSFPNDSPWRFTGCSVTVREAACSPDISVHGNRSILERCFRSTAFPRAAKCYHLPAIGHRPVKIDMVPKTECVSNSLSEKLAGAVPDHQISRPTCRDVRNFAPNRSASKTRGIDWWPHDQHDFQTWPSFMRRGSVLRAAGSEPILTINVQAVELSSDFSQSFARRRHLPSHAKVRSTTRRRGRTSNPFSMSDRLMTSVCSLLGCHRRTRLASQGIRSSIFSTKTVNHNQMISNSKIQIRLSDRWANALGRRNVSSPNSSLI